MTLPKHRKQMWLKLRSIRIILHALHIRRPGIERFGHVLASELFEGASFEAEGLEHFVDFRDVGEADLGEKVVGEGGAVVWSGNSGEGQDFDVRGLQAGDHVAGVEASGGEISCMYLKCWIQTLLWMMAGHTPRSNQ